MTFLEANNLSEDDMIYAFNCKNPIPICCKCTHLRVCRMLSHNFRTDEIAVECNFYEERK